MQGLFGDGSGAHCELVQGTFEQCKAYVTKDSDRVAGTSILEWGVPPAQGKRRDIDAVRDILQSGGGMREVALQASSFQALRGAEVLLKYHELQRDWKPSVFWFHGSTGSGKTRRAFELFAEQAGACGDAPWISGKSLEWWEGYDAHKFVIVDDFRRDFCTFHELLRILDRYPYRVMVKGGSRQLLAKIIVITCPWKPSVLFASRSEEDIKQLERRIEDIVLFGDEVPAPQNNAAVSHFKK